MLDKWNFPEAWKLFETCLYRWSTTKVHRRSILTQELNLDWLNYLQCFFIDASIKPSEIANNYISNDEWV